MSRVALITGGAQGLGAAAAKRLLKDGFTDILLLDRNAQRLAQEAAALAKLGNIKTLVCDLADAATPAKAIAACVQEFGRIDLLFNQLLEPLIENIGLVGHAVQNPPEELFVASRLIGLLFDQFQCPLAEGYFVHIASH